MIDLCTKAYCHDCPKFSPTSEQMWGDNRILVTKIVCEYFEICNHIEKHLEKSKGEQRND